MSAGTSSASSRRSGTGTSGSGRSTADYYQLEKSSPYHHGGGRSGGASDRNRGGPVPPAAPPQDYGMLLRQQEYEHRMAHHSGKDTKIAEIRSRGKSLLDIVGVPLFFLTDSHP